MLRNWTEYQKLQLLNSLRKHGVSDISKITADIPGKSLADVKYAIGIYERAAICSLKDELNSSPNSRQAPIDGWLDILKFVTGDKFASDDIASTFRFIAKFGSHNKRDIVNLKDCYEYIADLMMGKAPKQLNTESMEFIMGCILQMGELVKNTKTDKEEEFLSGLTSLDITQKTYGSKKTVPVFCDPALNILKVPAHLLKMDKNVAFRYT